MEIADKTVVSIRYIIKNNEGEELENTFSGPPVQYVHGAGKILPQLEKSLTGLRTGDKKEITLDIPDIFYFEVEIDDVRMATTKEMEAGNPTIVSDCGSGCCC